MNIKHKIAIKDYRKPFIQDALEREIKTNECKCDYCDQNEGDTCGKYYGFYIKVVEKNNKYISWVFADDLNTFFQGGK